MVRVEQRRLEHGFRRLRQHARKARSRTRPTPSWTRRPSFARSPISTSTARAITPSSSRRCRPTPRASAGLDGPTPGKSISLDRFYIAQPNDGDGRRASMPPWRRASTSCSRPAYYSLDDTLRVTKADTILLGLGVPSLVPTKGLPTHLGGRRGRRDNRRPDPRRGSGQVADASWRSAPRAARPIIPPTPPSSTT